MVDSIQKEITGTIFDIKKFAIHDGPGIRTTIFFKGCLLGCWWCHNPESREFGVQLTETETIGNKRTVSEIMNVIESDTIYYDESKGGVTFSGGEPLAQPKLLKQLLLNCKELEIHTAVDTTGYIDRVLLDGIIPLVDLFLYDLKVIDDVKHKKYTGVSNQLRDRSILDNLRYLSSKGCRIWIRIPIIPGINDSDNDVADFCSFISELDSLEQVNLLSYHKIAKHKYQRLGIDYRMGNTEEPSDQDMEVLINKFRLHLDQDGHGSLKISIGG